MYKQMGTSFPEAVLLDTHIENKAYIKKITCAGVQVIFFNLNLLYANLIAL